MKVSDEFKKVIADHLQELANTDPLFAETYKKEAKNIDDCCTYILNEVKKLGKNGFDDSEIYGMAVHYYDEDNIDIGKPVNGKVVVNHSLPADKPKPKVETKRPVEVKKPEIKKQKPEPTATPLSLF